MDILQDHIFKNVFFTSMVLMVTLIFIKQLLPSSNDEVPPSKVIISSDPPASSATSSKKKKKKAKKKKPLPVVEKRAKPESELESDRPQVSKKKKRKPKKKMVAPAPSALAEQKVVVTKERESESSDDDEEEEEDVTRLLNTKQLSKAQQPSKKKKKKRKKKSAGSGDNTTSTETPQEEWVIVNKSSLPTQKEEKMDTIVNNITSISMFLEAEDKPILVGPKGATIQNITTISGARLDIDLPILKISGTELAVSLAKDMVDNILEEYKARSAFSITLEGVDINLSEGVKAIIGKGGSTIQKIQATSGCKIDASIANATVRITGPSDNQVQQAATLCRHAVFGEAQEVIELETTTKVMLVMGQSFQKIRQFQEESGGAKLDIAKNSTTLRISGPTAAVQRAKQAVLTWLQHCQGITMPIPTYDNLDSIGAIYGKGGSTIRAIQEKTGSFIHVDDKAYTVQILGVPSAVRQALAMVQQAMNDGCLLKEGDIKVTISLGKRGGPSVIGRGGSMIRQLEVNHKCNVRVMGDSCVIMGSPENVASAKRAIEKLIAPILDEERIQNEADRMAEGQSASAWTATSHETNDADGW